MYKKTKKWYVFAAFFAGLLSLPCTGYVADDVEKGGNWFKPVASSTWQIQLTGSLNPNYKVSVYDIDMFDTPASVIEQMHADGKHVICYFSAGSSENWRPDFAKFKPADMGKGLEGWPGEKWLDVRSANIRAIMTARMDMAKQKGCDGIDPDNVDGYTNKPGLNFTAKDQLEYNKFLANNAHKRGLAVGLKNDMDQAQSLAPLFDFSVNEQCFQYNECDKLLPFIELNKPVFNIEYNKVYVTSATRRAGLCKVSTGYKLSTLVLPQGLNDTYRYSCLKE